MSILIKGMEMPENCEACWNCDKNFNNGDTLITDWMCLLKMRFVNARNRPDWCPLVPVPPHGWLIDADVLMEKLNGIWDCNDMTFAPVDGCCIDADCKSCRWRETIEYVKRLVQNQTTIVPAEAERSET